MRQSGNCPKCGRQNATGQPFCESCGAGLFGGTEHYEWPPLHILALDQQSKLILGFKLKSGSLVVLPAITTDGKLSMLAAGYETHFRDLQERVRNHIKMVYADCQSHVCFCLSVLVEDNPKFNGLAVFHVWNVAGNLRRSPEMDYFHDSMSRVVKVVADPYWGELEQFFSSEPQRSWINNLVTDLKRGYDWSDYVARRLSEKGFDYRGKWTDDVWVNDELERL